MIKLIVSTSCHFRFSPPLLASSLSKWLSPSGSKSGNQSLFHRTVRKISSPRDGLDMSIVATTTTAAVQAMLGGSIQVTLGVGLTRSDQRLILKSERSQTRSFCRWQRSTLTGRTKIFIPSASAISTLLPAAIVKSNGVATACQSSPRTRTNPFGATSLSATPLLPMRAFESVGAGISYAVLSQG